MTWSCMKQATHLIIKLFCLLWQVQTTFIQLLREHLIINKVTNNLPTNFWNFEN